MSARARLDAEALAWMEDAAGKVAAPGTFSRDEVRFESLALALFRFQFEACAPYRRFCQGRDATPDRVRHADDVPAVPAAAFKELRLACFPASQTRHVFHTSGTSSAGRGRLELDTLALYHASLLPSFQRFLLSDLLTAGADDATVSMQVLAPSPEEAPDSSLSHMFGVVMERHGAPGSGFRVLDGQLDVDATLEALGDAPADGPLLLCGTAFGFVHLIEALERRGIRLKLPAATRIMETGGFKGRARERPRETLYAEIQASLGVPAERIVNQYGMTELASQFHDSVLVDPRGPRRKLGPPWARVRIVDPDTGRPLHGSQVGMIRIHDLANTGSLAAIQTADLGRAVGDGFEVLGRAQGAEERGCSLALDEMLAGA